MFVSKINNSQNVNFRSLNTKINNVGAQVKHFNFVYDDEKESCEIRIYRVTTTQNYNLRINETPIIVKQLTPEGIDIDLREYIGKNEGFAYEYVRKNKDTGEIIWRGPDTGVKTKSLNDGTYGFRIHNDIDWVTEENGQKVPGYYRFRDPISNYKYTYVSQTGTTPLVQGKGYMAITNSYKPGMKYEDFYSYNTGALKYDKEHQKWAENVINTFSNSYDTTLASLHSSIDYLKAHDVKILIAPPIANGDELSNHRYLNGNNMQPALNMCNTENLTSFFRDLYKNGIGYVNDGTFSAEGLQGPGFQYALRWADKDPQTARWYKLVDLKNASLGFGVVPNNKENLRYRVINHPYNYTLNEKGIYTATPNPNYNSNKETLVQIYDASQVSDSQLKDLDKPIKVYENLISGNQLSINTHDDTVMNYVFQINPKEYDYRIERINELNKKEGKEIRLDTPDGTIAALQFSNFRIDKKTEGGFVTWDANTDLVKKNYHISGYDEKILQGITDKNQRYHEQKLIERATKEVQDMAVQSGVYWTNFVKDAQLAYTANTISTLKTADSINKLIESGKLPAEVKLTDTEINNILNGQYLLSDKGILEKDDITVKALMKTPLDSLEFGSNTVGVLGTSYFMNRATTDETIGVSRFDLMKQNNPHLVEPYTNVYNKVNSLYQNELKDFADAVIRKVNENSNEKILDSNGDYTEYGEYVMELVGRDIAKYALLKSLSGKNFETKILNSTGEITYDYKKIKENTTLKQLGINGFNPEDEANKLEHKIESGIKKLSDSDIDYVAKSINQRIKGTDTSSFRIAEAMVNKSGLGLNWRLDAAKDIMDIDAVRNRENDFDDTWNDLIKFWKKFVQGVKSENEHSYIVAELTDIADTMRETYGKYSCPYNGETDLGRIFNGEPDAMTKFFNETGITSEAAYSYFFTELLVNFSPTFDSGSEEYEMHDKFRDKLELLMQTRNTDYLRNLYTFIGNHDKARVNHGFAVDMKLFYSPMVHSFEPNGKADFSRAHNDRIDAIKVLSGTTDLKNVPIELRLNVDNNDYFRTVSSRAVAQSKLLLGIVDEDLKGLLSDAEIDLLKKSLTDLTNMNYMQDKNTQSMTHINIKELSSLKNAFEEILKLAENHGLKLTEAEKQKLIEDVVNQANNMDLSDYLVHADFNWTGANEEYSAKNRKYLEEIMGNSSNPTQYSLYTLQLARLLRDANKSVSKPASQNAIDEALKDFVSKYNRETVNSKTSPFQDHDDPKVAAKKNAYAARDIKNAITMMIEQAEFKSGKTLTNREDVIAKMFNSALEPAIQKHAMIMEFLSNLMGISTMYAGDEYGMSGYEEKTKNVYLQNRNALPHSEIEDKNSKLGAIRRRYAEKMWNSTSNKSDSDLTPLRNGTPYSTEILAHSKTRDEAKRRLDEVNELLKNDKLTDKEKQQLQKERHALMNDLALVSYMMYGNNGEAVIALFNAAGIEHGNRVDYFSKYNLKNETERKKFFTDNNVDSINPENKYVPIQEQNEIDAIYLAAGASLPLGAMFINPKDKSEYVVKEVNGRRAIVRKDGKSILLNGKTAKNGVMVLKRIFKKIGFRGNLNKQYNINVNPYRKTTAIEEGKNLSLISV